MPPLAGRLEASNGPLAAGKPADLRLEVRQVRPRNELVQDAIPDHGKWMHLALVRSDASRFIHLHPTQKEKGVFTFSFTPPGSGTYTYFGDVLRASGESDTVTGTIEVGEGASSVNIASGDPDDSYAVQPPLAGASDRDAWDVGDGFRIRWLNRPEGAVPLLRLVEPRFRLERADGTPVGAVDGYMGMAGHLMALRADHRVFAHVHPMGTTSAPMALAMLRGEIPDHAAMGHAMSFDPEVAFPYAFPQRGLYRIWVQMKHEGKVRTGVFDAEVL